MHIWWLCLYAMPTSLLHCPASPPSTHRAVASAAAAAAALAASLPQKREAWMTELPAERVMPNKIEQVGPCNKCGAWVCGGRFVAVYPQFCSRVAPTDPDVIFNLGICPALTSAGGCKAHPN